MAILTMNLRCESDSSKGRPDTSVSSCPPLLKIHEVCDCGVSPEIVINNRLTLILSPVITFILYEHIQQTFCADAVRNPKRAALGREPVLQRIDFAYWNPEHLRCCQRMKINLTSQKRVNHIDIATEVRNYPQFNLRHIHSNQNFTITRYKSLTNLL